MFNISASNWPLVFALIKTQIRAMAEDRDFAVPAPETKEKESKREGKSKDNVKGAKDAGKGAKDTGDGRKNQTRDTGDECAGLRLLPVCLIDRTRLLAVLQGAPLSCCAPSLYPACAPRVCDVFHRDAPPCAGGRMYRPPHHPTQLVGQFPQGGR